VLCTLALLPIEYAVLSAAPASAGTSPTVSAVSPDIGAPAGRTSVTITGNNFEAGSTAVAFGSTPAARVTVTSPTTLTATAPAHQTGSVDVTVTTASGGMSNPSPADLFAYGVPRTTGVSPGAGAGGTLVTVTGTSFVPGVTVSFGATAATGVTVLSATTLVATAPAGASSGDVDVTVTTPGTDGGTSAATWADLYAYAAPTVTAVTPDTGPALVGTTATSPTMVTINGTDFSLGDTVLFGLVPAADVTVWSPYVITVAVPASLVGGANVTVTNAVGTSSLSVADQFAAGPPTVTGLSRTAGPPGGGETVGVTGTGFVAGTTAVFGSVAATAVTVVSPTLLDAIVPPGDTGSVGITVTTWQGPSAPSVADLYAYGPPTVTAVSPDAAATAGGTTVTITGTGFVPGATVSFGTTVAPVSTVGAAGTWLQVAAPAARAGSVDVRVTTTAGRSAVSVADLFADGGPAVTSVAADAGPRGGGNDVIVAGSGFVPGLTVYFGARAAPLAIVQPGGTGLHTVAPPGTVGRVDVTVRTAQGRSVVNRHDSYFYGPPAVTRVTHPSGSTAGDTAVTIIGTGFSPHATVSFGMRPAAAVTVTSPTSITAVSPAANPGVIGVRVSTSAGLSRVTPDDQFVYGDQLASSSPLADASTFCNSIDLLWVGLQERWQAAGPRRTRADRGRATLGWSLGGAHVARSDVPNPACRGSVTGQLLSHIVEVDTRDDLSEVLLVPARSAAPALGAG
jgi:hypothetical protein